MAQEREAAGMDSLDSGPSEMMERYRSLSQNDKKRLEHDEDRLLSTMLYNLVAFMIMMRIDKMDIKKIIRRLLGRDGLKMFKHFSFKFRKKSHWSDLQPRDKLVAGEDISTVGQ